MFEITDTQSKSKHANKPHRPHFIDDFYFRNRCGSGRLRNCVCIPWCFVIVRQGTAGDRKRKYHRSIQSLIYGKRTRAMFKLWSFSIFQILFVCGLACVIGLERTFRFFFKRNKIKASLAFFGGIIVVLIGWPIVGMIVESYGFFLLFRYVEFIRLKNNSFLALIDIGSRC